MFPSFYSSHPHVHSAPPSIVRGDSSVINHQNQQQAHQQHQQQLSQQHIQEQQQQLQEQQLQGQQRQQMQDQRLQDHQEDSKDSLVLQHQHASALAQNGSDPDQVCTLRYY